MMEPAGTRRSKLITVIGPIEHATERVARRHAEHMPPAAEAAQHPRPGFWARPSDPIGPNDVRSWSICGRSAKALIGIRAGAPLDDPCSCPQTPVLDDGWH
jgi:hypothetical protein